VSKVYENIMLWSYGISTKGVKLDVSSLYWITKLHKYPYVDGSSKWTTEHLSKLLIYIKIGLLGYCGTSYYHCNLHSKFCWTWVKLNVTSLIKVYHQICFSHYRSGLGLV